VTCNTDCTYAADPIISCEYCGNGGAPNAASGEICESGDTISCVDLANANVMYGDFTAGTASCSQICNWNTSSCISTSGKRDKIVAARDFKFKQAEGSSSIASFSNSESNILNTTSYMFIDTKLNANIEDMIDSSDSTSGKNGGWQFDLPANTIIIGSPVYFKTKAGRTKLYFVTYTKAAASTATVVDCTSSTPPPPPGWAYLWEVNAYNSKASGEHIGFKQDRIIAYLGRGIPSQPQIINDTLIIGKLPCVGTCETGSNPGTSNDRPLHDSRTFQTIPGAGGGGASKNDPCSELKQEELNRPEESVIGFTVETKAPIFEMDLDPCNNENRAPKILWWKVQ